MQTYGPDGKPTSEKIWQHLQAQGGILRLSVTTPEIGPGSVVITRFVGAALDGNKGKPRIFQVLCQGHNLFKQLSNHDDIGTAHAEHNYCLERIGALDHHMDLIGETNIQFPIKKYLKEPCPICSSKMRLKRGKYGYFYGCEGFPSCPGSANVVGIITNRTQELAAKKAPVLLTDRRIRNATIE